MKSNYNKGNGFWFQIGTPKWVDMSNTWADFENEWEEYWNKEYQMRTMKEIKEIMELNMFMYGKW